MSETHDPFEAFHTQECAGNFVSVCGDSQRCDCGLDAARAAEATQHQQELLEQRVLGHGEGQEHAIADVNAGRVDEMIAPRLALLQQEIAELTDDRDMHAEAHERIRLENIATRARLAAVEAERDQRTRELVKMADNHAKERQAGNDEVATLRAERDRLKAALEIIDPEPLTEPLRSAIALRLAMEQHQAFRVWRDWMDLIIASLKTRASAPPAVWQDIETCPTGVKVWIGGGGCPEVHVNILVDFGRNGKAFGGLGDAQRPTHWQPYVVPSPPTPGENR